MFWGLYQSGKTETLQALQDRLEQSGRQVHSFNAANFRKGEDLDAWFLEQLICIPGCLCQSISLNQILPGPVKGEGPFTRPATTIIIDHFDAVMKRGNIGNIEKFVADYAQQSHGGKRFNVLLCVSSVEYAKTILNWNGRRKILLAAQPDCQRWTAPSVTALINALVPPEWDSCQKEQLIRCGVKAGSPSFVTLLNLGRDDVVKHLPRAEIIDADWNSGCEALAGFFLHYFK